MHRPNFVRHEGLAALGARSDAEVRPRLLRILTDLYVQKLQHTAEEERHYTELALRLLPSADAETRRTVARRLTHYPSSPAEVLQRLAKDLLEVASPAHADPPPHSSPTAETAATAAAATHPAYEDDHTVASAPVIDAATARQLNTLFLAADAGERRLILRNLDIVAPLASQQPARAHDAGIGERLEAAALSRKHEEFAQLLTRALQIPRAQAHHILRDELGEALVVAVKALGIAPEVLYRILLFANPSIGHSVERVNALAGLYDEITPAAAAGMVAIWQALDDSDRAPATYRPLTSGDAARPRARPAATAQGVGAMPRPGQRREAS